MIRWPEFRDSDGVTWRVRRAQWPLLGAIDMASHGSSTFGVVLFLLALPLLAAWPIWLLAKLCGVPWKVVTERDGDEVAREKVKGWRASGRRIQEIVAEKKATAAGDDVGFELRETTGTELGES
ncbi:MULTISPECIES: hypothetical protein [Mycobacteriaceae]|uniref:Uncharacterized protein n=1 Tax=Mycolicibacterium parafortuitum TaxID=39692 RepID=A0ACC6MQ71_MYCPF|nr:MULTISPECIES: hypothetical protein [Mycobacteriaceae]MDZ5088731.1 hypothetical protein [Mycolicibacterium parafortuitum]GFM18336.1 uncharacterized protein PO1_contig-026-24 [Mycobacterium sp. PO1]GFM24356.1 uncharacterized protein PO2_contig-037-24 [Mycobacterium sp. PO2]